MTVAVDTSVLLDILVDDARFAPASEEAIRKAGASGRIIVCEIVVAEILPALKNENEVSEFLSDLGIDFEPCSYECSLLAGMTFSRYLINKGKSRRVMPDFMVAAHALTFADALLTRDRGYYRDYFKKLKIVDPSNEGAVTRRVR